MMTHKNLRLTIVLISQPSKNSSSLKIFLTSRSINIWFQVCSMYRLVRLLLYTNHFFWIQQICPGKSSDSYYFNEKTKIYYLHFLLLLMSYNEVFLFYSALKEWRRHCLPGFPATRHSCDLSPVMNVSRLEKYRKKY